MKANDMSESELLKAAINMEQHGGGFAEAIAAAYRRANRFNAERLVNAFPELFEKYAPGRGWDHE